MHTVSNTKKVPFEKWAHIRVAFGDKGCIGGKQGGKHISGIIQPTAIRLADDC